ncbi:hypothetical protein AQUSIP_20050 [Aquicella siphonis]|uniref:Uncharacterized protein n=1 Tax=Aquicella siphonis TaxID=254247 RepID=A0A5E4PJY3_9COXI|nr:hypothetical protein [Aquicella siphonis]VVC76681.1 hypothetical protein AQUSIP_20050 [Aquicella siphonis]
MLPRYFQFKSASKAFGLGLCVLLVFVAIPAHAQLSGIGSELTSLTPEAILANIQRTIPNLTRMVTAIAYVMGMYMIISGVVKLKHVGEMRTQMSYEHSIAKPIVQISVGALLLYLPTSVQVGMSTFWTDPNPYGYVIQQDQWEQFINVCFVVVQFIGIVAFIRGLVMLSHLGGQGGHQNSLSRGLTHVIGGILCINIYQFLQVVLNTIGIQS